MSMNFDYQNIFFYSLEYIINKFLFFEELEHEVVSVHEGRYEISNFYKIFQLQKKVKNTL